MSNFTQTTWAQLTAPGVTPGRSTNKFNNVSISATIANINTNVVLRVEGSNNGTNWGTISTADLTVTANSTVFFNFSNIAVGNVRLNFVSESGGTAATVDAIVRLDG